jgi:radical SAM superfamily enzyme YgiQ (UPF0313 family)
MSEPLRVLLVNAINPRVEVERRYPNLGLGYLVSSARRALGDEAVEFRIASSGVVAAAREFRPRLVGISAVSQNFGIAKQYADVFASEDIPVVMGGVHVSALPESIPGSVRAACLGEGEETFVDIIRVFLEERLSADRLASIPGIAFRDGERVVRTEPRPPLEDLDALPMPDRSLLSIRPHTYMFTSRGCPYRCAFCASSRFWDKLRFFSAECVVDEIELLVRDYRATLISFFDDLFAAKKTRLEEILRLLERRGLLGGIQFTCNCRANVVDAELADLLARLGVISVGMGLESGDDEVLSYLKGGTVSVAHNRSAIEFLKNAGIAANGSFVIGSPRETREQVMRTYDFIRASRLDLFDVYLLTPYPGTPVWEYARKRGLLTDDLADWSALDVNLYRSPEKAIFLSEVLAKEELIELYRKFRRLRLRRNLLKIWTHPLRRDAPGMAWRLLVEKISGAFGPERP